MLLEPRIDFILGLLQKKEATNGDQRRGDHGVIQTHVFDKNCIVSSECRQKV